MKKCILSILFLGTLISASYARERDDSLIVWSESYKLQVADFKGKVPKKSNWAAITSYIIYVEGETTSNLPKYIVEARFNRYLSWMKVDSELVLRHEQLHFDIAELFARKMRVKLHELVLKKEKSIKTYNKIFTAINKDCFAMQQEYDKATKHGTIPLKQKAWSEKVKNQLQN